MKNKTIPHFLKRSITRFFLWGSRTFNPNDYATPDMDPSQKKTISICNKMINHPDSDLLISPVSEKRYIRNGDYFLVISSDSIKIVNHVYSYDINLHGRRMKNLKSAFDKKVDSIRIGMEKDIMKNVTHSLDDISKKMHNIINQDIKG